MNKFEKDRLKRKVERFFKENFSIKGEELIIELNDNLLTVKVLDNLGNLQNNSLHFKNVFNKFLNEFKTEDSYMDITGTQAYMFFVLDSAVLEEKRVYRGEPKEFGGTSIRSTGAAPSVKWLFESGIITKGMKVLDYGAGKYGRNAEYLKEQGCIVYAYDPYNGGSDDGWTAVSSSLPESKDFDVVFSSYVLNVVPDNIEDQIIQEVENYSKNVIHITRNMDIYDTVKAALLRGNNEIYNFFISNYADEVLKEKITSKSLTKQDIIDFCVHGTVTSKGFQRIPQLEDKGYTPIKVDHKFKIYKS